MLAAVSLAACDKNDSVEEVLEQNDTTVPQEEEPEGDDQDKDNDDDSQVVYMLPATRSVELTTEQRAYVARNNDFAFDFYRQFSSSDSQKTKSNVVSPLSLSFVLGMLNDGAQGKTEDEIASLVGFGSGNKPAANEFFKTLMEELPKVDDNVTLLMSNMVAYDRRVMLEDLYRQDMASFFHADLSQLYFSRKAETARYINEWCNDKTQGMIPEIVSEDEINEQTALALLNAIYFKATWAQKFDPTKTCSEAFYGTDGSVTLPMMHCSAQILYAKNDIYSMVNLPYGSGDKWSMKVLLPNEGHSLDDIINRLTNDTWKSDRSQMRSCIVDVKLPRFKTETTENMNDILANMGAKTMFLEDEADFSPLTKNFKKSEGCKLWVSLVKQAATTEVDEEGTKLAAVTVTLMDAASCDMTSETADFHCNRPFLYIIQEASSGAILSIGSYRGN